MADPLLLRIVELLASEQLCINHLAAELEVPQLLVSHHLKVLRDAGLLASERYRYWTYYRLRPGALLKLATWLRGLATTAPAGMACRRPPTASPTGAANTPGGSKMARDRQLDPISRLTLAAVIEQLAEESPNSSPWRRSNATSTSRSNRLCFGCR